MMLHISRPKDEKRFDLVESLKQVAKDEVSQSTYIKTRH